MVIQELSERINNFYDYMGRDKKPIPGRISLWFEQLRFVDGKELFKAFDWMKDNLDSLPHNIPKAIKNAVFMINKADPDKQSISYKAHREGICDGCNGTGMFKTREYRDGQIYEPIQFCAECNNYKQWTNNPGNRVTRKELEMLNVKFKPYDKVLKYSVTDGSTGTQNDIKNLAADIGNDMYVKSESKMSLEEQKEILKNM